MRLKRMSAILLASAAAAVLAACGQNADGQEKERIVGAVSKNELKNKLEQTLA